MPILVADCPRCGAQEMTFDLLQAQNIPDNNTSLTPSEFNIPSRKKFEAFCVCRNCHRSTIFVMRSLHILKPNNDFSNYVLEYPSTVNAIADIIEYVCIKDMCSTEPPEHVPSNIEAIFREGATCLSVECFNAAGTMFRLCVDLATKPLLLKNDENGLNNHIRRTLGPRLNWLFENNILPDDLHELSGCIRDDGNDGAHQGTLQKVDAEDLLDFTGALLERLYTEPEKLKLAKKRRTERRSNP